jgi:hypothetical protein
MVVETITLTWTRMGDWRRRVPGRFFPARGRVRGEARGGTLGEVRGGTLGEVRGGGAQP